MITTSPTLRPPLEMPLVTLYEDRVFIGIDNGVTGSIGIITPGKVYLFPVPTIKTLNYTKKKGYITRIDFPELLRILSPFRENAICLLERPMVNPKRFQATTSALRAFEVTIVTLEWLKIPYEVIDSKEWQKVLFPKGIKGSAELKKASISVGKRLFPMIDLKKSGCKDYDGLLIAEYARRTR